MEEITELLRKLQEEDAGFDGLVTEIVSKLEQQIETRNEQKSFYPTDSRDQRICIKVKAVPITKKEKDCLVKYLNATYLSRVAGDYFVIEKCRFTKKYRVESYYDSYGYDFDIDYD